MADTTAKQIALEIIAAQEDGPPLLVATVIAAPEAAPEVIGAKMLVRMDGSTLGTLGSTALDEAVSAAASDTLRRHATDTIYFDNQGRTITRQATASDAYFQIMLEAHERPAALLVIGGGHVGKALAAIGHLCGFSIEIVDDRPEFASAERFPEADRITCGRFEDVLRGYPIDSNTYVVCVTRGHKHDQTSLSLVAESPAAYVGMIGSKRRVRAVLQYLVAEGLPVAAAERVHTPIGLDIGAETPEEIAVSIMAEIIRARRGGTGERMRDTKISRGSEDIPSRAS